jgi:hypothetical protein
MVQVAFNNKAFISGLQGHNPFSSFDATKQQKKSRVYDFLIRTSKTVQEARYKVAEKRVKSKDQHAPIQPDPNLMSA